MTIPSNGPTYYRLYQGAEISGNIVAEGTLSTGSNTVIMDLLSRYPQGFEISAGSSKNFIILFSTPGSPMGSRVVRLDSIEYATDGGSVIDTFGYSNVGLPVESVYRY